MKRIITIILIGLLVLSAVGCEEFIPAIDKPQGSESESADSGSETTPSENLADDPEAFTVSLRYNDAFYKPKKDEIITAQWTDGKSVYTASFGEDGYARIAGLDGDYNVTLKGLPEKYVYNPNAYKATNDERNIVIDIYKPVTTKGYGTGAYDCIQIKKNGVYRVQLESAEHKVFFQYAPPTSGTYWVESWVSTTEGNYNPKVDVYSGSIAYKLFAYTLDNGGYCDGYTQNFKHIVEIADEHIGETGQAVFTFAVHADSKNGIYPIYIDFAVSLNGSFALDGLDKEIIIPEEQFKKTDEYDKGEYTFKWAETDTLGAEGRRQFDGDMFKLWSIDEGGDGYYHVYNKDTGEYGEILYAKLSEAHRFSAEAFTTIEDAGNSALTVNGYQNHKLFIEGIESLLYDPLDFAPNASSGGYFCLHDCPCRMDKDCIGVCGESCEKCAEGCRNLPDATMKLIKTVKCAEGCPCLADNGGYCEDGCTNCLEDCVNLPTLQSPDTSVITANGQYAIVDNCLMGYASFTNSDGVYAVTEEIKYFLQSFSITQRYFADGEGWVETHPQYRVDAKESDQWLFACGYYVKTGE